MTKLLARKDIQRQADPFLKRFALIDFLRGFCIVLVIFDHIMWNFGYFFPKWCLSLNDNSSLLYHIGEFSKFYWTWGLREGIRFFVLGIFVLLSGISVAFSKNNSRRTLELLALVFVLSVVSNLLNALWPVGCVINFNILGVLGISLLLFDFVCKKTYRSLIATTLGLFLFEYTILPILYAYAKDSGALVIPLWQNNIMINGQPYYEADYMPLFPYIIFFFVGVLLSVIYYFPKIKNKQLGKHHNWQRPLCFIGRHSLPIYLFHQIIFQGMFMFVGAVCNLPI